MILDIPTLAIVEPIILMVEVFILWFQFHLAKSFVYVKFWISGTSLMACGVFFMPMVRFPSLSSLAICSNPLYVMGLLLLFQGTVLLLQKRYRIRLIAIIYSAFMIPYFFFIFQNSNVWMRNLIVNSTYFIIFILIAGVILKSRKQPTSVSYFFTAGIFFLAAIFSLLFIISSFNKPFNTDYLGLGISLPLSFLLFAIFSILWTFGFILIHQDVINYSEPEPYSPKQHDSYNLSEREAEILSFLEQGLTYDEIAKSCFISKNTVKTHIKNIYIKYNVSSRINLLIKLKEAPHTTPQ